MINYLGATVSFVEELLWAHGPVGTEKGREELILSLVNRLVQAFVADTDFATKIALTTIAGPC